MVVVVLVIGFGGVEFTGGGDFGFDIVAFLFEQVDEFLGYLFLVVILIENGRTVLGADIRPLTVELGEVVGFEKETGEFFVTRPGGIKSY